MKVISAIIIGASIASTSAFVPAITKPSQQSTQLNIVTKGKAAPVRKAISSLTKDNFDATLTEIEPFLTKEAGVTIYNKSMKRIAVKANSLGVSIPDGWAKDAKCTQKRREKQDAYCKAKTEEAAATAADAAAEAEAPAEEEAEAPAEEEAEAPAEE